MKWTTEVPTEPGYYWAYEALDPLDADVMLVNLTEWGVLFATGMSWDKSHFSHWMGPLEVPRPPDVDEEE